MIHWREALKLTCSILVACGPCELRVNNEDNRPTGYVRNQRKLSRLKILLNMSGGLVTLVRVSGFGHDAELA